MDDFHQRLAFKASAYQAILAQLIDGPPDVQRIRQIIIANRDLLFDDQDFLQYARNELEICRRNNDGDGIQSWQQLIELIISTIVFFD